MEMTIPAVADKSQMTLPMLCADSKIQYHKPVFQKGQIVDVYTLLAPMALTAMSELWFAESRYRERCVVKFCRQPMDAELLTKIQSYDSPWLAKILSYGRIGEFGYEVYPFYKGGSLDEPVSEDTLKTVVLPSLIKALKVLHNAGLAHNDIKPSNIFWAENKRSVVLGDFGCVSCLEKKPGGITPSYAAPELLSGGVGKRSTDWCSVGLTLASLHAGKPLIPVETPGEARYLWETGVRYSCDSHTLQQLINGMIQLDPRKRLGPKAANNWCNDLKFGFESRKSTFKNRKPQYITVEFENPSMIAVDIPSLLQGIELHWQHSTFLFRQKQFDRFLNQFDNHWTSLCKEIRKKNPDDEEALFMLTMEMTGNREFIWRGKRCSKLIDLEEGFANNPEREQNVISFLQKGLVEYYLKKIDADQEQRSFAKRLQVSSHYNGAEACLQLFQALRGDEGFSWHGDMINDLTDLARWLEKHTETLDEEIEDLMSSRKFEAWLEYQGLEGVIQQIRRRCANE